MTHCVTFAIEYLGNHWFRRRTTNWKWPTGNQMVKWPLTSRDLKGQTRDPNTRAQYLEPNISKTTGDTI